MSGAVVTFIAGMLGASESGTRLLLTLFSGKVRRRCGAFSFPKGMRHAWCIFALNQVTHVHVYIYRAIVKSKYGQLVIPACIHGRSWLIGTLDRTSLRKLFVVPRAQSLCIATRLIFCNAQFAKSCSYVSVHTCSEELIFVIVCMQYAHSVFQL